MWLIFGKSYSKGRKNNNLGARRGYDAHKRNPVAIKPRRMPECVSTGIAIAKIFDYAFSRGSFV